MKNNSVADETDISSQPRHVGNNNISHGNNLRIHQSHKVGVPQSQGLLHDFSDKFKEIFFHDDPLYEFKDQSRRKKLLLGIQSFFPIVGWARDYNLKKFRGDLIAGLTIASLCIPQVPMKSLLIYCRVHGCTSCTLCSAFIINIL
jgi:sulfate transporter 1, high-affinity